MCANTVASASQVLCSLKSLETRIAVVPWTYRCTCLIPSRWEWRSSCRCSVICTSKQGSLAKNCRRQQRRNRSKITGCLLRFMALTEVMAIFLLDFLVLHSIFRYWQGATVCLEAFLCGWRSSLTLQTLSLSVEESLNSPHTLRII